MSSNRLFIYDPETKEAICIAKGYSTGWVTGIPWLDEWLDTHIELTGNIDKTRFTLITEGELKEIKDNT